MASQKPAELQGGNQSKRQTRGKDNLSKETEKSEYTETRLQYRINAACIFSLKVHIQRIHLRPRSNCAATGKSATKTRHRTPCYCRKQSLVTCGLGVIQDFITERENYRRHESGNKNSSQATSPLWGRKQLWPLRASTRQIKNAWHLDHTGALPFGPL